MARDEMNPLMAMALMANGTSQGASGSSENGSSIVSNMPLLRLMFPDAFEEEIIEAVWEDAVPFGSTVSRSGDPTIGTLSVMVIPPTPEAPKARLRIGMNGNVFARPEHLKRIGDAFLRWAKDEDLLKAWNDQKALEPGAAQQHVTTSVMKAAVKGGT